MSKEKKHALSGAEGLIPELRFPEFEKADGWKENDIGKLFKFKQGVQVAVENQYPIQKDGMVRFIRIIDITSDSEAPRYIENPGQDHLIEKNDLFMIRYGTPGLISMGFSGVIANNLFRLIWNNGQHFVAEYWFYSFQNLEKTVYNLSGSSSMPAISFSTLDNLNIRFPNNPQEQQKIASCLSSLDELIAAHNDKLDTLKDHKKGLMQNLFPNSLNHDSKGLKDDHDFDAGIKSRNQANQKNQGSDNVPKVRFAEFEGDGDWVEKTIGEFAPLQRGFDLPVDNIVIGDYPVVFSNGILKYHNEFKVNGPGVVTGRSGTIGKVTYVEKDFWPHNTSLWVTDFCGNFPMFVFYYFVSIGLQQFSAGGGVPTLNRNDVHRHNILVPPTIQEQQKIASCLSALDELITAQTEKIEQLQQHKKGLMQGLFPKISDR